MSEHRITDGEQMGKGTERDTERYFVEEKTDAFGIHTFAVLERGEFEEANHEWRMVPRESRVLMVSTDEREMRREARHLNSVGVAS